MDDVKAKTEALAKWMRLEDLQWIDDTLYYLTSGYLEHKFRPFTDANDAWSAWEEFRKRNNVDLEIEHQFVNDKVIIGIYLNGADNWIEAHHEGLAYALSECVYQAIQGGEQ